MISPQYLMDHTVDYVGMGDASNEAGFWMRTPNHGLCNGGLPLYMFRLLAQYGSATCTAQNCSSGCYPYEGGASSGDTGQQSGDGFNGRFKGNHNRWGRRRRTRHGSPHAHNRQRRNSGMLLQQWAPPPLPKRCADNQCEQGGHNVRQCVFAAGDSADCVTLGYWSPHAPARIMSEVYKHGPVTATMQVFGDSLSDFGNTTSPGWTAGAVFNTTNSDLKPGMHAVKIVGWGTQGSTKYWLVANSWGTSWNGDGYFKIKRGTNFCQIEQNVCYASPDTNTQGRGMSARQRRAGALEQTRQPVSQLQYASQTKNLFSTHPEMMPGSWREQSNVNSSALVVAAAHHVHSAAAQHTRRSLSLSADPAAYAIVEAHTQAVAGTNMHIVMSTADASGRPYLVHAVVHKDLAGKHSTLETHAIPHPHPVPTRGDESNVRSSEDTDKGVQIDMGVLIALLVVAFFLGGCIVAVGFIVGSAHRTRPEEPAGTAIKLDAPSGKSTPRERTSSIKAIDVAEGVLPETLGEEVEDANFEGALPVSHGVLHI